MKNQCYQNWQLPFSKGLLLLTLLLLQQLNMSAQCSPDILAPSIQCPANLTVTVAPGICSTTVTLTAPIVNDNCPGSITLASTAPSNSVYPLGTTPVVFTATDAAGNPATCQTTVTVSGGFIYSLVCNDMVTIPAHPSGITTLVPEDILEGGPYNCVETSIAQGLNGTCLPSISIAGTGTFLISACVALPGGGFNKCWGNVTITGNACSPDVTPPTAVCVNALTIQSNLNGPNTTLLAPQLLDNGSFDACSALTYRATLDVSTTTPPLSSAALPIVGIGTQDVALWVGDAANNWNKCIVTVTSAAPKCTPDVTPPTCIAPPNLTITHDYYESLNLTLTDSLQMVAAFGTVNVWDNCSNGNASILSAYSVVTYPDGSPKEITRSFLAIDAAGNTANGVQKITILPSTAGFHVPAWFYPGDLVIDSIETTSSNDVFLAASNSDQVFIAPCNGEKVRIERIQTIFNWLDPNPNAPVFVLPALDLDNDGQLGDPYDVVFFGDSLWLVNNGQLTVAIAPKVALYHYIQHIRYNNLDMDPYYVSGNVFLDSTQDCNLNTTEQRLGFWKVKVVGLVSGTVYTGITDANGYYNIDVCQGDTSVELSLDVPFVYNTTCPTTYIKTIGSNNPGSQNIPVQLEAACPRLSVNLSTQRIRPCFNDQYQVQYCNLSTQAVSDAHIEVELDPYLLFNGASIPGTFVSGNTFDFVLGTLAPGDCGTFQINYTTDCNTPVGITHCSEAHIFPDAGCITNPGGSGALLKASADCDGDSVRLSLKNIGNAEMATAHEFVIVEDLIMYMSTPFQLGPGESTTVAAVANGATYRIQSEQVPSGVVSAFVEGCGGFSQSGLPLVFPLSTTNSFVSTDCMVNVSSFDPNDKQAVPTGYAAEHFIEKNTPLQYNIRFQNTGTDTAYTVVLLDTLSAYLDVRSIAPGAASHPYDVDIINGNVLRFRFDRINLPDSTSNPAASQGFVKYEINQLPNNPEGSKILNTAAIYFDNNAPVLTNTTLHTIGSKFISVETDEANALGKNLKVYPNPASTELFFELPTEVTKGNFVLTDALGRKVTEETFIGNRYRFERKQLPSGVYFFRIMDFTGKIILK